MPQANIEADSLFSIPYAACLETRSRPRYDWDNSARGSVPFVILQYTLSGHGRFQLAGITHEVPPGSALIAIVPEKSRYFYPADSTEPWAFCWLNFYNAFSVQMWRRLRARFGPVIKLPAASSASLNLLRLTRLVEHRKFDDRFEASQEAYAFYMSCWRQLSHPTAQTGNTAVAAAVQYCREHFRDPMSVKELAAQSGLTREHFSRLFKEQSGQSPGGFLRGLRLEAASELLSRSALPLKEVALRSGFATTRQLVKAYRGAFGKSPRSSI